MTGGMVREAILNFFHIGNMPRFLGETKWVWIPKTPNPTHAKEFRPISYCNVIYKCIAKLLCLRLKEVVPHLIQQNQGAFVMGRELLFNILMCQDIARGYSRKGVPPRCIMKIDLQKAFDSVHWDFLKDLLHHLKFPFQFVTWVMAYITSVTYRVHDNGMQREAFEGWRGLNRETRCVLCCLSLPWSTTRLMTVAGE